jgi:ferric-dicitrate binding protein FerR (iron transport regulator)
MDELLFKYFMGKASPEEKQRIGEWLDADSDRNGRQLKSARFIFEGITLHGAAHPASVRPRRMWALRRVVRYAAGIAASVVMILGAGYLTQRRTYSTLAEQTTVMTVPAGQRLDLELPDGSKVKLNAGTRLECPVVFANGERRVKLSGEAMFEVTHDDAHPFVVETFASTVEVLGTKFNVRAEDGKFAATLLEGSVQVVNLLDSQPPVILHPGEVANLVGQHLSIAKLQDDSPLCWIEGMISIKGADFGELMAEFEKAYGVKIVIDRPVMPSIDYTRGKVRISDGIDHALRILMHASDFTYERNEENNVITIL